MGKFVCVLFLTSIACLFLYSYERGVLHERVSDTIVAFGEGKSTLNNDSSTVDYLARNLIYLAILMCWVGVYWNFFKGCWDIMRKRLSFVFIMMILFTSGCRKPFEPVDLQTVEPNEAGFLLSNTDVNEQSTISAEDYAKKKVLSQQVKIPQMWVDKGYNTFAFVFGYNGEWIPASRLIRVDMSPVTEEWTADPKTGTSDRDEAIWVMTSDQVEFSTGWTCTARIASVEDAAKFLSHNRNGTLAQVMRTEVRGTIQSEFGLAVTDLPMDQLKSNATPVITKVVDTVKKKYSDRGITITNLGITGGFVYRNPKIQEKMAEVFTAEQEKSISIAKTVAQEEENKRIQLEAQAKADAILTEKQGEADAIKLVADAKAYEIEKAKMDLELYTELKRLELEAKKIEKWSGSFPTYFMGDKNMDLLLEVPKQ